MRPPRQLRAAPRSALSSPSVSSGLSAAAFSPPLPAMIMGGADLRKMDNGTMDPEGRRTDRRSAGSSVWSVLSLR